MSVTLGEAQIIIEAAVAKARAAGGNAMSIAVVDSGGYLVMLVRMDDANPLTAQIAEAKASGCAIWRKEGEALAKIQQERPIIFQQIDRLTRLPLIPSGGSLLIRRGGRVVGAVGVSAAPDGADTACAQAGLDALERSAATTKA